MDKTKWTASFTNNTAGGGLGLQDQYFAAIGATATAGKWYTTCQRVWVSAGASYGPQVEFASEAAADAFVKANSGTSRSTGTRNPRVDCLSVPMFVKAFKAAKGEPEVVVKQPLSALVNPSLELSLALVEEEEAEEKAKISPRDAAIAALKAARPERADDEAFIERVLARMGL